MFRPVSATWLIRSLILIIAGLVPIIAGAFCFILDGLISKRYIQMGLNDKRLRE
jgi:hypothetical protein